MKPTTKNTQSTIEKELYSTWKYIKYTAIVKYSKSYEGVPCEWETFEEFYNDNVVRYRKAKAKWAKYKCITHTERKQSPNPKLRTAHFIRKVKSLGFTKENTCFTSPSDKMKYHKPAYKYILSGSELGTRELKNLLKKKGIVKGMAVVLGEIKTGINPFKLNHRRQFMWKGEFRCLRQIEEMEGIEKKRLSRKVEKDGLSLQDAIEYCKNYKTPTYLFEGAELLQGEIVAIICNRTGLERLTVKARFSRAKFAIHSDITNHTYKLSNPIKNKTL